MQMWLCRFDECNSRANVKDEDPSQPVQARSIKMKEKLEEAIRRAIKDHETYKDKPMFNTKVKDKPE